MDPALEFPKCLYKPDRSTYVVKDADAQSAALKDGWSLFADLFGPKPEKPAKKHSA